MAFGSEKGPRDEDRRHAQRNIAFCAAEMDLPNAGSPVIALIHDISPTGALLLTATEVAVGTELGLRMQLSPRLDDPTAVAHAKVVRSDRRRPEQAYVWSWQIAVLFGQRIAGLEHELEALLARRRKLGL